MESTTHVQSHLVDWLRKGPLALHVDEYTRLLTRGGYAPQMTTGYLWCLKHFAFWLQRRELPLRLIDETMVGEFVDGHLPHCDCSEPIRGERREVRAALRHLLVVLRAAGAVAPPSIRSTPVREELRRFDEYMEQVRGLAPKTRGMVLRIVRQLLESRFGEGLVVIPAIKPEHVRRFFAQQCGFYRTPASASGPVSALRGYFRYRAACGDAVHGLIGAVPYPANWKLSSLPKALSAEEIQQLVASLGQPGRSRRRADAIVRCALDLGLRSGEIATLALDDIDWRTGTLTLRRTKSRRQDVLPLPMATGDALFAYLKHERPKTTNRAVFVRHMAPRDLPFGADGVRKIIRQAYARAGLLYTRSHLLRHTMASRILESGGSLKEVADVLRHRSLNTSLIYAKLDSTRLRDVALPWPGVVA